ncbi:MAG: YgiQ family radical SAM protein [Mailhella sp.]|nr:YgiQ family radical SAM protein [Mailhella sp.]
MKENGRYYRTKARGGQTSHRPGNDSPAEEPGRRANRPKAGFRPHSSWDLTAFLPMTRREMDARGWKELDVLLVFGDSYIDHPGFAAALLGRFLEFHGYRVGIITQPDWNDPGSLTVMGRPRLFAGVSAGAVDSMLAHYTAFRKKRHNDAYTPGGKCGARPNRAVTVYTGLIHRAFPGLYVAAGGIEASLRRVTHYDFWSDSLRKSLLPDSKADLLIYGMGEKAILALADRLKAYYDADPEAENEFRSGKPRKERIRERRSCLAGIDGTARMISAADMEMLPEGTFVLPSHEEIAADAGKLIEATLMLERHVQKADCLAVQRVGDRAVLLERPAPLLSEKEMDAIYDLPYTRKSHPSYKGKGAIPAESMMKTSMTCHRGCGGGCSFCSLALHQGRRIASRSRESLIAEAKRMAGDPEFDGSVSDIGGPSANMWRAHCAGSPEKCRRPSCMTPKVCPNFKVDQNEHLDLLREVRALPGVRHVRVASGVRFDLALKQKSALEGYAGEFTGGQLKVAPEHCSRHVLKLMRKPGMEEFEVFLNAFYGYCRKMGKEQYVVPYLMSAFPGCTDADMRELADWLAVRHWKPRQVQCFIPTPGTVATAMYYAELDPDGFPIYVAKTDAARLRQHGILLGTTVHPEDKMFEDDD